MSKFNIGDKAIISHDPHNIIKSGSEVTITKAYKTIVGRDVFAFHTEKVPTYTVVDGNGLVARGVIIDNLYTNELDYERAIYKENLNNIVAITAFICVPVTSLLTALVIFLTML